MKHLPLLILLFPLTTQAQIDRSYLSKEGTVTNGYLLDMQLGILANQMSNGSFMIPDMGEV